MQNNGVAYKEIRKFAYIDILRGCAILGVLMVHASQEIGVLHPIVSAWSNYGQMGVQLFFVASAVTLCMSAFERRERTAVDFLIRRFFRIAPLYYFGVVFYFAWRGGIASLDAGRLVAPDGYSLAAVAQNIFFVHGFSPYNYNSVVPGGWSISAEMAFYLLFPLLFALLGRISARIFTALTLAVVAVSFGIEWMLMRRLGEANDTFGFIYASIVNQLPVFMIGLLTFKMLGRRIGRRLLVAAAGLVLGAWYIQNNRTHDTGFDGLAYALLSAVAFGIITVRLSSAVIPSRPWASLLQRIGQNSFSMYLMHFAVLDVLRLLFSPTLFKVLQTPEARLLVIFCALVWLSYWVGRITSRLIEEPSVRLGKSLIRWRGKVRGVL